MMRRASSDSGFTLVELLVSCLLLVLVLTVVATLFISISTTQRVVAGVTGSTTDAQVAATSIENSLRNASEFRVTVPTGTDQLLVARVADQANTLSWSCRAWYYSATNKAIYTTRTNEGTKIAAPTTEQLATWAPLVANVTPRSGTSLFSVDGAKVTIAFNTTPPGQLPIAIQLTAVKQTGATEAGTCY